MDSIDSTARENAWEGLVVLTIILTLLVNAVLLFMVARAAGGLSAMFAGPRGPRSLVLLGLIIGDCFVALFSLVVYAIRLKMFETKGYFRLEKPKDMSCRTVLLSVYYLYDIMPFTYGIGFVLLAVEGILFRRRFRAGLQPKSPGVLITVFVGAVPWILALVIALPLTTADQNDCWEPISNRRLRDIIIVCQVIPVAVSVFTTIVNLCIKQNSLPVPYASVGHQQEQVLAGTPLSGQSGFTNVAATFSPLQAIDPAGGSSPQNQEVQGSFAISQPPPRQEEQGNFAISQPGSMTAPVRQDLSSERGQRTSQTMHVSSGSAVRYSPHGATILMQASPPPPPPPPPSPGLACGYNFRREKIALLVTNLAYFVCVVPNAVFDLSYWLNHEAKELRILPLVIINDSCFWLVAVRPLVVPFFWLVTGSFRKPGSK